MPSSEALMPGPAAGAPTLVYAGQSFVHAVPRAAHVPGLPPMSDVNM
jgi:hypothetical protein